MTNGEWADVIDVNLSGPSGACAKPPRLMAKEGRGAMSNIASSWRSSRDSVTLNYGPLSKAGLIALTKPRRKNWGF